MSKIVVIHGSPGSGKTTHARRLKEMWSGELEHLSIGDRLRAIGTGKVSSQYKKEIDAQSDVLAQSAPLSHEVVNGVVFEFIEQCPAIGRILVDGYPRFIEQLPLFYASLTSEQHECIGLIQLQISTATAIARLTGRGNRSGEKPVTEEFARWRNQEFNRLIVPAIALLGAHFPLITIDAEPKPEVVWQDFKTQAEKLLFQP